MNLNKENSRRIRGIILFTVILFLGIQRFDVILTILQYIWNLVFPFFLGLCIAYIISVPERFVERVLFMGKRARNNRFCQKVKRPFSIVITFILLLGVIAIVSLVVIPELVTSGITVANKMKGFGTTAEAWIDDMFVRFPAISDLLNDFELDWSSLGDSIIDFIKNDLGNTLSSTIEVTKDIVSTLVSIGIALFFSIYVLIQREKLGRQVKSVMSAFMKDKVRDRIIEIARLSDNTFANFLSGQCIEAVILGTMFVITMSILQFPYAVMIGVLIAFMALIPVFGAFIGCGVGTLIILVDNPQKAFWFIVLFLILQLLEENLIYPHVVGNAVGLPAIWVLAAVTLGGSLFGVAGMLFFIPLTSVFYTLFRELVYNRIKRKKELAISAGDSPPTAASELSGQQETVASEGNVSLINGDENESGQPNDTKILEVADEPVKKQKSRLFGSKKPKKPNKK